MPVSSRSLDLLLKSPADSTNLYQRMKQPLRCKDNFLFANNKTLRHGSARAYIPFFSYSMFNDFSLEERGFYIVSDPLKTSTFAVNIRMHIVLISRIRSV